MIIALASDHGGFELKEEIRVYLDSKGHKTEDLGAYSDKSVDYPVYGEKCAKYVVDGMADRGIVFCGTGIGVSIAANKVKGARCALLTSEFHAEMAAAHNHANVIALGGRTTALEDAIAYIERWLSTPEDHTERHERRVSELNDMP
jgi:ribose 5-phosphate isomerase B